MIHTVLSSYLLVQHSPLRLALLMLPSAFLGVICALALIYAIRNQGGLLRQGLELNLAGRPAEAERCFRKALANESKLKPSERASLLISMGDALMDQGRYDMSRQYLDSAMKMGDPKGSCCSSMAQWYLLQGNEPEKALALTEQSIAASATGWGELTARGPLGEVLASLTRASLCGDKARALAMLNRQPECQQAIYTALQLVNEANTALKLSYRQGTRIVRRVEPMLVASAYWRTGLALLGMHQASKASEHFTAAAELNPNGKFGSLSKKELTHLATPVG
jgi:tetratricopeptide (TPR) repeat protein